MKKRILQPIKNIRFRRWSRKNYAVFAGLNKVISIGKVCASISDKAILKTNSLPVFNVTIAEDSYSFDENEDEKEPNFLSVLLNTNTLCITTDVPVGCGKYYLLTRSWNGLKASVPTFLF